MGIRFIMILIILLSLSSNADANAENNNSSKKEDANDVSIMEKTSISDLIIIILIVIILTILISSIVEIHRNRCEKGSKNIESRLDNKKIDQTITDFSNILVNSQQLNLQDMAHYENSSTQNEVETEFVEIKINKDIYKKLLLKSEEMKTNPIDVLNEIIEKWTNDR